MYIQNICGSAGRLQPFYNEGGAMLLINTSKAGRRIRLYVAILGCDKSGVSRLAHGLQNAFKRRQKPETGSK